MAKPSSRILVINDEHLVLREFVKGLNAAARSLDNPLGISFVGVATAKEALSVIEKDGDLQAVLVDDTLYSLSTKNSNGGKKNDDHPRKLQMSALELVQRITRFRPELHVYILDRKSTRLNSSHLVISYAVFCLKKKKQSAPP